MKETLEDIICMEEIPNKIVKIVFTIVNDCGSLFSAFINSAMLSVLHNGISIKKTIWAFEFSVGEYEQLTPYPQKKEETIIVVINLNNLKVVSAINS